jgi:hypothetical protein
MINDNAQPIYIYPDQLLKETWPIWVESIFSKQPDDAHQNARGFQELSGSTDNSTVRTRAGESYRLGLLLQRVIRERTEGSGIPKGWQYVCEGKSVISRTGYLSYAIGKALSNDDELTEANTALNVLYLLFALSLGIRSNEKCLSTALIYAWTLQYFRNSIGAQEFDTNYDNYSRFLAAAVFKTLDTPDQQSLFLDEYINLKNISTLILEKASDHSIYSITPALLRGKINGSISDIPDINNIPSAKAPLFWASINRGIFQKAKLAGDALIQALIPIDQAHLQQYRTSVLTSAIQVTESEDHMLLEKLDEIFKKIPNISPLWSRLMDKLTDGVYASLAYVEKASAGMAKPKKFHLHGASYFSDDITNISVELNRHTVPIKPEIGTLVVVGGREFKLKNLSTTDSVFKLELEIS